MGRPQPVSDAPRAERRSGSPTQRRRKHRRSRSSVARGRLRTLYFVLSSGWGFTVGTAAILGTLSAMGKPVPVGNSGFVIGAGVLAVIGGVVAARAYHEASKRLGG